MHALIIEDELVTAQLIEDRLRALGYLSFAFATDEGAAVAEAAARCPDLITSGVPLTPGCGIDTMQRTCDDKQPIAVLYITGVAATVRDRCPWAIVIQKPFGMSDLRAGVRDAQEAARGPVPPPRVSGDIHGRATSAHRHKAEPRARR